MILEHAEGFARERGFNAFSYADLSKQVGIRKASIHHHFATKADLARDMLESYTARFKDTLSALEQAHTGAERLHGVMNLYRDALRDGQSLCLCVAFSATRDSFDADVIAMLDRFHTDTQRWIAEAFEAGQADGTVRGVTDPLSEAAATLALLEGAQLLARAGKSPAPFDQATTNLRKRLNSRVQP